MPRRREGVLSEVCILMLDETVWEGRIEEEEGRGVG